MSSFLCRLSLCAQFMLVAVCFSTLLPECHSLSGSPQLWQQVEEDVKEVGSGP